MLEAEPEDAFLLYAIAQEYLSQADIDQAKAWFERVYSSNPDYLPTYYHYGLCLVQSGENEKAERIWREGFALANEKGDGKTANEIREVLDDWLDIDEI